MGTCVRKGKAVTEEILTAGCRSEHLGSGIWKTAGHAVKSFQARAAEAGYYSQLLSVFAQGLLEGLELPAPWSTLREGHGSLQPEKTRRCFNNDQQVVRGGVRHEHVLNLIILIE